MSIDLRICLYDQSRGAADAGRFFAQSTSGEAGLGEALEELGGLTLVGQANEWAALEEHLRFGSVDAVAINLDGLNENPRFFTILRIAEVVPDCAIIGISSNADPDTIIGAMRAGCTQFVRAPIDMKDLRAAIDRVRQTRTPAGGGCLQVAVIGSSGGAGSTTVACNLALELAHVAEQRAALVDMNLQFGDVACAFDRSPKYSITDLCLDGVNIDQTLLETALDALPCNVSLLARPEDLEDTQRVNPEAVEQLFRCLSQMFPFVIVDLPRHFTHPMVTSVRTSDHVFIVSQLAVPALRNATRIYRCLLQTGIDEERIELVLNRCNATHERIKPQEVEKHFGRPVYASIPNDYKHIGASRDLGHPILATAPNSPARLAIRDIARRLAVEHLGEERIQAARGGLRNLFRKKQPKVKQSTRS